MCWLAPILGLLLQDKMPSNVTNFNIRDVWKNNMEEEFAKIRDIIENYPYVAMVSSIYGIFMVRFVHSLINFSFRFSYICRLYSY